MIKENISETILIMKFPYQMICFNFLIVEIIFESVNLIPMSKQNQNCYHDGEQLGFFKKSQCQNKHAEQRRMLRRIPMHMTKTVLKTTSNTKFNMKKVDLNEL